MTDDAELANEDDEEWREWVADHVAHFLHAVEEGELTAVKDANGHTIVGHYLPEHDTTVVGQEVIYFEPIFMIVAETDALRELADLDGVEVSQAAVEDDLDAFIAAVLTEAEQANGDS